MMNIAIVGCGNMGLTYARAILKFDLVNQQGLTLVVRNDEKAEKLIKKEIGTVIRSIEAIPANCDIIVIAVKPQDYLPVAVELTKVLKPNQLVISVMAGITIEKLQNTLSHKAIVRAMPNTPAKIGMGITGFAAAAEVSTELIRKAEKLLSTTGREVFLDDESLMDAVTALSGSGPAYFYLIVKSMIEAGVKMGMEESMAALLVKQTMLGAYHLMNQSDKSLDELIAAVKSKGGTTEAALNKFIEKGLPDTISEALHAAEKRAKELSA